MRLADAIRVKPDSVTTQQWEQMLTEAACFRMTKEPHIPVTYHLAEAHEEYLTAWREDTGQEIPGFTPKTNSNPLAIIWRLCWVALASLVFGSWALLVVGTLVTLIEPKKI